MAKSVLLVSDDEAFRSKVAILVHNKGFNYVVVKDIESARSALVRSPHDLVLIDSRVGPVDDLKSFANKLHGLGFKVLVALQILVVWQGLKAPFIHKARVEADLLGYLEVNFKD